MSLIKKLNEEYKTPFELVNERDFEDQLDDSTKTKYIWFRKKKCLYLALHDIFLKEPSSRLNTHLFTAVEKETYIEARFLIKKYFEEEGFKDDNPFFKNPLCNTPEFIDNSVTELEFSELDRMMIAVTLKKRVIGGFQWPNERIRIQCCFSDISSFEDSPEIAVFSENYLKELFNSGALKVFYEILSQWKKVVHSKRKAFLELFSKELNHYIDTNSLNLDKFEYSIL